MLCYRCEYRAQYHETKNAPRYECKQTNQSITSCYMYKPVNPVVLKPLENDPRPIGPSIIACRSQYIRTYKSKLQHKQIKDGIVILCSDEEETEK